MRPWLRDKLRLKAIMKSCLLNIKAAAFSLSGQTRFVLNEEGERRKTWVNAHDVIRPRPKSPTDLCLIAGLCEALRKRC